jgi:hypothetical protein
MGRTLRTRIKALIGSVLSVVVAGSLAIAGPAAAKPTGSGGGGPVTTEQSLVPSAAHATIASEIYLVLIAAAVIAVPVVALAVLGRVRARGATYT